MSTVQLGEAQISSAQFEISMAAKNVSEVIANIYMPDYSLTKDEVIGRLISALGCISQALELMSSPIEKDKEQTK